MTTPMLQFDQVTFGYLPGRAVLQEVSFSLQPGRVTAIMGPNGVGKSTLLNLALGWLLPWQGRVLLDGRPLRAYRRQVRGRLLALVPQKEQTSFDYSVLEYVLMGRSPHMHPLGLPGDADLRAALQAIERVGIMNLADVPVPHLSGGEHQLMLVARAMVQEPRLLLLDEPTSHLDLHNKARLLQILRDLRQAGSTLLMTNHEPDVVLALADDVLLLEPGRPAQFGAIDEVFTAETLSRMYRLPIRLVDVDGCRQVLWT